MPSERLTLILRAKSEFTPEEIAGMSEAEGWRWVYANKPPPKKKKPQVCFTGFTDAEKDELRRLAGAHDWLDVVGSVTKDLEFLCTGPNAGPAKLAKAKQQDVVLLTRDQFEHLLQTGEVPQES